MICEQNSYAKQYQTSIAIASLSLYFLVSTKIIIAVQLKDLKSRKRLHNCLRKIAQLFIFRLQERIECIAIVRTQLVCSNQMAEWIYFWIGLLCMKVLQIPCIITMLSKQHYENSTVMADERPWNVFNIYSDYRWYLEYHAQFQALLKSSKYISDAVATEYKGRIESSFILKEKVAIRFRWYFKTLFCVQYYVF